MDPLTSGRDSRLRIRLPERVEVAFDVFLHGPPGAALDPWRVVRRWVKGRVREPLRGRILAHLLAGGVRFQTGVVRRDAGLPSEGSCCFSLPEEQRQRLARCNLGVRISSSDSLRRPRRGLWAAVAAASALASRFRGLVYARMFPFFPWRDDTVEVPPAGEVAVTEHVRILSSVDERGRGWVTTVGMGLFGLPNLQLREVPPDLVPYAGRVLNAAAQRLADVVTDHVHRSPGATPDLLLGPEIEVRPADVARAERTTEAPGHPATIGLRYQEGKGLEPFLTLCPPAGFGESAGVWYHDLVGSLLGDEEDAVIIRPPDDVALARAHDEAVRTLPDVKRRFQKGLARGDALFVKHGFGGPDWTEYMWVAVTTWRGRRLQGNLSNEPRHLEDLRAGQPIELDEDGIYDWLIEHADGATEGDFTGRVLLGEDAAPGAV